jgi:hypothetical protein
VPCSVSTGKAHFQSASTASKPLRNWSPEKDTLRENPGKHLKWTDVSNTMMPYAHQRPLPAKTAEHALNYISAIVRKYPFQLRYSMAMPLWDRFCEEWCETGDERKSLLAI